MSTKIPTNMTPEEWYKGEKKIIDKAAQQQYEEAYVNNELMNKYLKQNLAEQGLANTGMANLYAQQANTDYMNKRAEIAKQNQANEQTLYDAYYNKKKAEQAELDAKKKEEQDNWFNYYLNKLKGSANEYGFIEADKLASLQEGWNPDQVGATNLQFLNQYAQDYAGTEEQKLNQSRDQTYTDFMYDSSMALKNSTASIDEWYSKAQELYDAGQLTKSQFIDITDYLDEENRAAIEFEQNEITDGLYAEFDELKDTDGLITPEEAKAMYAKLEENRELIGRDNYDAFKSEIASATMKENEIKLSDLRKQYPYIDKDAKAISYDDANLDSFGSFLGTNKGTEQDTYVQNILDEAEKAANGESSILFDGAIVDFNYGQDAFRDRQGKYMYYQGKFYKVNGKTRKDADIVYAGIGNPTPIYNKAGNRGSQGAVGTTSIKDKI